MHALDCIMIIIIAGPQVLRREVHEGRGTDGEYLTPEKHRASRSRSRPVIRRDSGLERIVT